MSVKAGFVSIIGKPNVGKSTLMNALIGEKLSITTNKPQTTRKKIIGILSTENYQIIFQDTPGILNPEYLLQERMYDYIIEAVKDADLLLFMIDISTDPTGQRTLSDERVYELLKDKSIKKLLLINKIDLVSQNEVEALIRQLEKNDMFEKIIPISATANYNLQTVIDSILEYLPEHPKYFPDDQLSDASERFFVSEIIREKIFEMYQEEIPYSTEVVIEEFKERENAKDYIRAVIVVEKETQKPIIIGAKGEMIKKLGKKAREAIEAFLGREVYLELYVKVREKWRSNPQMLKLFGYNKPDEK
ncbi:GTPase Era [Melioribacter sp. OK-6-Me]|uniref:GTPase Era n=1 Tax=unclassified Melioribacter TaxID=2627329 RepID=UPI003EDAD8FC